MVKAICHKFFATALSVLMLFSTFSFTVEKHFCGDILIEVSVFTDVSGCGSEKALEIDKKPCCKDVVDVIEGQDDLIVKKFDDLEFSEQLFFTASDYTAYIHFEDLSKLSISEKYYKPPLLVKDIQVFHDTFLI